MDHAGEADRLGGQVDPGEVVAGGGGVALVEHEVEDAQHRPEACRELAPVGHGERLAARLHLRLGPADPLSHGRLGHQERGGDLPSGEPPDGPQGQRDRRARRQRRVAAQEQQPKRVVLLGGLGPAQRDRRGQLLTAAAGVVAAELLGEPPRGDPDQPPGRVVGHAAVGPLRRRGDERLLDRVLRIGEVAVAAQDRAEGPRREVAQEALDANPVGTHRPPSVRPELTRPVRGRPAPGAPRCAPASPRRSARATPTSASRSPAPAPGSRPRPGGSRRAAPSTRGTARR